ncbi:uncharacterized protein BYT42DRAFT_642694 [Radiomyces spectabilis]|uniref:uncharacterized protein n=1 Tax=Radiomyces spectabilis TaxID=64574 RepID=UPI0022206210|nr:uncharacterized protein BYT42DRAFT_642694 [Radiomyces spectabilis]KAI8388486.1 hypothetical protein BYT42DRAFT_642694 [Radiomyces spectabilis]
MHLKRNILLAIIACGWLYLMFCRTNGFDSKTALLQYVQSIAIRLRSTPYSPILLCGAVLLTSIPPFLGFTLSVTMCGYIYGFSKGLLPAISGAFVGALMCFKLCHGVDWSRWMSAKNKERYQSMQQAIQYGGVHMIVCIRISPIPWQLSNLFLSTMPGISFYQYTITAAVSCFKVCLEVWIGSQLADLSQPMPPSARRVTLLTMLLGATLLLGTTTGVYRSKMKKAKEFAQRSSSSSQFIS